MSVGVELRLVLFRSMNPTSLMGRSGTHPTYRDRERRIRWREKHSRQMDGDRKSGGWGKRGDVGGSGVETCALPIYESYFSDGTKWHAPDLQRSGEAYQMARESFEADGRRSEERRVGEEGRCRWEWS